MTIWLFSHLPLLYKNGQNNFLCCIITLMNNKPQTDCLFLHIPNFIQLSNNTYKLWVNVIAMGVFSMCNELYKHGFNPEIIHYGLEKVKNFRFNIRKYIKQNNIKIVAISLHWHYQTYDSLMVAKRIKEELPETFIFLGGYTSSAFAEDILQKYDFIDAIIKGEGEKPVVKLVSLIKNGEWDLSDVPNLLWRKNGKVIKNNDVWFANEEELNSYNFNGLRFLEDANTYLHLPIKLNVENENTAIVLEQQSTVVCCLGRGCPGNCTWCGGGFNAVKQLTGRNKITLRNPEITAQELLKYNRDYGVGTFYFCYDPYPKNQDNIIKVFEIMGKEMPNKLNVKFECFGLPTFEFIDAVKNNLGDDSQIIISPEFGNEDLRIEHKGEMFGYTNDDLLQTLKYIKEKNIPTLLYFAEVPFQDDKSKQETKDFIEMLETEFKDFERFRTSLMTVNDFEPYAPWTINPEKYGVIPNFKTLDDYVKKNQKYGPEL